MHIVKTLLEEFQVLFSLLRAQLLQPYITKLTFFVVFIVKGKYKVYNLCSERLYDASLFGGKVGQYTSL